MSENCNQNCGGCSEDCAERVEPEIDFSEKLHDMSSVKKVIGVVSGKGASANRRSPHCSRRR